MKKIFALALALAIVFSLCSAYAAPASESANTEPLVYWSMWDAAEPQGQVLKEAIDAFVAETGIQVQVEFKGRQGIRQGLQPALDANTKIDLFDEGVDRVTANWSDYIIDLEDLVAASNYEDTAISAFMTGSRIAHGGVLNTIPYQGSVWGWFYNPEIFAEAGIEAVPSTWDEFLDCCEKVKAAGYIPVTSDDAYILYNFGFHAARYGGTEAVADAVMNGNWEGNEAMLKTAQDFQEMAELGYWSPLVASNVWPNGQNVEFALGDVAMYCNGSWLPNEIRTLAGDDFVWGCFAYPNVEGGLNDTSYNNTSFQTFAITKTCAQPENAFKLITWLTKGEWDYALSQASLGVPADVTNTEWPAQMVNVKPVIEETTVRYPSAAGALNNADVTPILKENVLKLCGGQLDAEAFIAAMEAATK